MLMEFWNLIHGQIADEELKLHLEDSDSLMEHLDMLLSECMEDFPEDDKSAIAEYAAKIARANITEQTRTGHMRCVKSRREPAAISQSDFYRIIKAYIAFHLKRNPKWDPKEVSQSTPHDIWMFITQKCGAKEDNFDGKKVHATLRIKVGHINLT